MKNDPKLWHCNVEKQSISQIFKSRAKRQTTCASCKNLATVAEKNLEDDETSGRLIAEYSTDVDGCRVVRFICGSDGLNDNSAIIYGNANKNNPLISSSIGTARLNLTCNSRGQWKVPNSKTTIWNVTCLLRENPLPTTTATEDSMTTSIPCSTCTNIKVTKVQKPEPEENDGKLVIQYITNSIGCRVAQLRCGNEEINIEAIIYVNGAKNIPIVSNSTGIARIQLICNDFGNFIVPKSSVSVKNATCLLRETVPTITTTAPLETTFLEASTTTETELCGTCENIATVKEEDLQDDESNGRIIVKYSTRADGCREANILCGTGIEDTLALIYFNGQKDKVVVSNSSGTSRGQLHCTNRVLWRLSNSRMTVKNVSCLIVEVFLTTEMLTSTPEVPTTSIEEFTTTAECKAKWTAWGQWSVCTDSCGAFGSRQRSHSCQRNDENCQCFGNEIEKEDCNIQPCLYPRTACRPNYVVSSVKRKFACVKDQRF